MGAFLAGLGVTVVAFLVVFGSVVAFAGVIGIIRAAINKDLGSFSKIVWILLCFIPGMPFLYFAFVDKNGFLKLVGWVCILTILLAGLTGGTALWSGFEALKQHPMSFSLTCYDGPEEQNTAKLPRCDIMNKELEKQGEDPQSPDDSSIAL